MSFKADKHDSIKLNLNLMEPYFNQFEFTELSFNKNKHKCRVEFQFSGLQFYQVVLYKIEFQVRGARINCCFEGIQF